MGYGGGDEETGQRDGTSLVSWAFLQPTLAGCLVEGKDKGGKEGLPQTPGLGPDCRAVPDWDPEGALNLASEQGLASCLPSVEPTMGSEDGLPFASAAQHNWCS